MADEARDLKVIDTAEEIQQSGISPEGLESIFDSQRLIGVVLAQMSLLDIMVNSASGEERRKAAYQFLRSVDEDPERIADRLRASAFQDMSLEQLEDIVRTGEMDPEEAKEKLREATS